MGIRGIFRRTKRKVEVQRADDGIRDGVKDHLSEFIATRDGVEAWVEQEAGFNKASILLVAKDGEWTRRAVGSEQWAFNFAAKQGIPAYQAGVVGYPQRKRDWDERQRRARRSSEPKD